MKRIYNEQAVKTAIESSKLMRRYRIQDIEDLKKSNIRILQESNLNLLLSIKIYNRIVLININLENSKTTEKRFKIKKKRSRVKSASILV